MKEFTCALCGTVYKNAWTKEEAVKEMHENFGNIPEEQWTFVCTSCYEKCLESEEYQRYTENEAK